MKKEIKEQLRTETLKNRMTREKLRIISKLINDIIREK